MLKISSMNIQDQAKQLEIRIILSPDFGPQFWLRNNYQDRDISFRLQEIKEEINVNNSKEMDHRS